MLEFSFWNFWFFLDFDVLPDLFTLVCRSLWHDKWQKRIFEYLAVRQLENSLQEPLLCFFGLLEVVKTSISKSIVNKLDQNFQSHFKYLSILLWFHITFDWTISHFGKISNRIEFPEGDIEVFEISRSFNSLGGSG